MVSVSFVIGEPTKSCSTVSHGHESSFVSILLNNTVLHNWHHGDDDDLDIRNMACQKVVTLLQLLSMKSVPTIDVKLFDEG